MTQDNTGKDEDGQRSTWAQESDSSWDQEPKSDEFSSLERKLAGSPKVQRALRPGDVLEHFELTELLGSGGMGQVWRARDTNLGRHVAIKAMLPERVTEARAKLFVREALALARLNHPNIVQVHHVSKGENPFLVMEYARGRTLASMIDDKDGLAVDEALAITIQIVRALVHVHSKGMVHRDLKPLNVIVGKEGTVRLVDFGLAALNFDNSSMFSAMQLAPGQAISMLGDFPVYSGTAAYMAPEQWASEIQDGRTDIWALGVSLFEMVTGKLPFPKGAVAAEYEARPALGTLKPDIPQALESIVARCLQVNQDDRYKDSSALLNDLEALERARKPRSRRTLFAFASVVLTAGLIVGAALIWNGSTPFENHEPAPVSVPSNQDLPSAPEVDATVARAEPVVESEAVKSKARDHALEPPELQPEEPHEVKSAVKTSVGKTKPKRVKPKGKTGLSGEIDRLKYR